MGRDRTASVTKPDVGLIRHLPAQQADPRSLFDCNNIRIREGRIEKIAGYKKFSTSTLNASTKHLDVATFYTGAAILLAVTPTKLYKYNTSTNVFDDITGSALAGSLVKNYFSAMFLNNWVLTDAVDAVRKWTGSGNSAVLGGLTDAEPGGVTVNTCDVLCQAGPFLLLGATTEGGSYLPLRVRWNAFNILETWKNDANGNGQAGFMDISEGADFILNIVPIGNYWAVYKEKSVHLLTYVGSPVIWARRQVIVGRGLMAPRAVVSLGDFHIGCFNDNFYIFNGAGLQRIGDPIRADFISSLHPSYKNLMFAFHIEDKAEIVFAYANISSSGTPNQAVVYNYITNSWSWRDFSFNCSAPFITQISTTWTDLVGAWNQQTWLWSNRVFLSSTPLSFVGDSSGLVHTYDVNNDANGADILAFAQSALSDAGYADRIKRLFRLKVTCEKLDIPLNVYIITADKPKGDLTTHGPYAINMSSGSGYVDVSLSARYFAVKFESLYKDQPFTISGWTWIFSLEEDR